MSLSHARGAMTVGDRRLARLLNSFPEIVVVLDGLGNLCGPTTWPWTSSVERWSRRSACPALTSCTRRPRDCSAFARVSPDQERRQSPRDPSQDWRRLEADRIDRYSGALVCKGRGSLQHRDLTDRRRFEMARDNVARFRSLVHNATTIMMYVSPVVTLNRFRCNDTDSGTRPRSRRAPASREHRGGGGSSALRVATESALRDSSATHPVVQALRLLPPRWREMTRSNSPSSASSMTHGRGLVVTAHDVSARVAAEMELRNTVRELRETSSLLNATLESTGDGLLVVSADRTSRASIASSPRCGDSDQPRRRRDDRRLIDFVANQLVDPRVFVSVLRICTPADAESNDTLEFVDGRVFQRLSKPQYVSGDVVGRVWSFSDVTEQKRLENDLDHLASTTPSRVWPTELSSKTASIKRSHVLNEVKIRSVCS